MKINNYIVIIIVFLLMSAFIYNSLDMINEGYSSYKKDYIKKFVLIKEEGNNYFWNQIENGIVDICNANNIAIEILDVSTTNLVSQKELLEMAIISKPNGIIMNGYNSEQMQDVLEDAQENNIPIVFINDDGSNLLRKAYVGPNNYKIGQKAIQELIENMNKDINVLIVDDYNLQNRSLLIDGIISEIDSNENIKLNKIVINDNRFKLENDMRKIIIDDPNINAVIGTNIYFGSSIAKAVVEMNKVGEIDIIALDNSYETLEYINKGIITATLFIDGYKMGVDAVTALLTINEDEFSLDVYYTPTTIINNDNIDYYLERDSNE